MSTASVDRAPSFTGADRTLTGERDAALTYRKVLAVIAVACGVVPVISPFALKLFDRATAGERVTDRFRATMSTAGLHELQANFATVGALADQFVNQTGPGLARAMHMSTARYDAFIAREFPKLRCPDTSVICPACPKRVVDDVAGGA